MADRETVIRALELCRYDPDPGQENKWDHSCLKCPYCKDSTGTGINCAQMYTDAIALLLRGQEKTKVVFRQYDGSVESECGNCGLYLDKTYSVCPKCGKELDWNA